MDNIKNKQIMIMCYHCKLKLKSDELMLHIMEHSKEKNPEEKGGGENKEIEKPKEKGGE